MLLTGRAFVFGDDIDTDALAPGALMKLPADELARHCLRKVDPEFADNVRPGDFVVAGRNFGMGSSREQAAASLKILGVSAVIAGSFARIFYRNAINFGLPAIAAPEAHEIRAGDELTVDMDHGAVRNLTRGGAFSFAPFPPHIASMISAGGLVPSLKKRLAGELPKD